MLIRILRYCGSVAEQVLNMQDVGASIFRTKIIHKRPGIVLCAFTLVLTGQAEASRSLSSGKPLVGSKFQIS